MNGFIYDQIGAKFVLTEDVEGFPSGTIVLLLHLPKSTMTTEGKVAIYMEGLFTPEGSQQQIRALFDSVKQWDKKEFYSGKIESPPGVTQELTPFGIVASGVYMELMKYIGSVPKEAEEEKIYEDLANSAIVAADIFFERLSNSSPLHDHLTPRVKSPRSP